MKIGTVKRFDDSKGFGWIGQLGREDIYVHVSGVVSKAIGLKAGDVVTFEVSETPRGPRAVDVRVQRRQPAPLGLKPRAYNTQRAD